ncbi:MaoC/PaaZ C-terminal domain-containing protein [Maricaulis sp.]|uniref:MaoC/PaaZ C-terminal domain-containing protein n=1 Tax=Maricaulis sp. TaxID=1486257 RepID=UPI00262F9408|nr:MaoC/PaaZ C-terminal domain-containing protein [Maricaulis sp.]
MKEATLVRSFRQSDFDAFAALSGDDNAIHTDPAFAARTRFGKTVAHGAMLCAVLRGLVDQLVPGGRQLRQSTMYPAPSPVDEVLRFEARIREESEHRVMLDLSVLRVSDGEITCRGETEVAR